MAAGLQIWNANGVLILDATSRLGRVKAIVPISGTNGSFGVDLSDGTPFWSFQPDQLYFHISNETASPIFTTDANGVYWSYSDTSGQPYARTVSGTLIVGVY